MHKHLLALVALVAALAIPVGLLVSPAYASAQPTCSGDPTAHDGNDFVGWQGSSVLGTNGYVSANIVDYANVVQSGTTGNVRGEVRVDNGWVPETATASAYIEAGVVTTTSGDKLFIEYKSGTANPVYTVEASATAGSSYAAKVTNLGSNSYKAQIGSYSLTVTLNSNGYAFQPPKVTLESQQRPVGGLCNAANMGFTSVTPSIVGGQYKLETDTTETKFSQYYDAGSQSFVAFSPWVPTGNCGNGGPCIVTH